MPKFFIDPENISGNTAVLTGDALHHAQVLRLREGEEVTLCDGAGNDYACAVSASGKDFLELKILSVRESENEPAVSCRIYMAFAKADKLEHVIQKATELGAAEIVAFPSARCVAKPDEKSLSKKLERWQKIAASAAEQSGRSRIPAVRALPSYRAMLTEALTAELPVLFYENEDAFTFRRAMEAAPFSSAALITGPEGGFDPGEVREAAAAGVRICTLGKRILRCETAPLCALSALLYQSGEF